MESGTTKIMNRPEVSTNTVVIENIAPNGLGFGEGGISVKKQLELGILTDEAPRHVEVLLTKDYACFKPVETGDDGCGDGRPWIKILRMVANGGIREVVEYKKSLLRAKVFGGGLVTASSMWRAISGAPTDDYTAASDRDFMATKLAEHSFEHGAHTDNHAIDDKCGCGAIDNYEVITSNAIKYRQQIYDVLKIVYSEDYDDNASAIEEAFGVYEALSKDEKFFANSNGKFTMEQIIESGAVVKELYGRHVEETIVINNIPNTTLDQQYFTQTVKNMCVDKPQVVQAFTVDTWRGKQIAEIVAKIAHEFNPSTDIEHARKVAFADFLIRTLAVSGTLTAGDLPVYRRSYDR